MAINSLEKILTKWSSKYTCKSRNSKAYPNEKRLELDSGTDDYLNSDSGNNKLKDNKNSKSPYLKQDGTQLLAKVTPNKTGFKSVNAIKSSIPFALNIYKACSDDLKSHKMGTKKNKKSVLTLPNEPAAIPQTCTVSDMNEAEYFNTNDDSKMVRLKKRYLTQNKKSKIRSPNYIFHNSDGLQYSEMSQGCIITDAFTGDGRNIFHKLQKKSLGNNDNCTVHDIWTTIKNINRFQFRPSPPVSDDSMKSPKKKKIRNKKRQRRPHKRIIETYRAAEFAYISSLELDSKSSPSLSQSSNFDRITVIDKQNDIDECSNEFQNNFFKINRKLANGSCTNNKKYNVIPEKTVNSIEVVNNQILSIDNKRTHDDEKVLKINESSNINTVDGSHLINNEYNDGGSQLNNKLQKSYSKELKKSNEVAESAYVSPLYRLHSGSSKVAVTYIRKNCKEEAWLKNLPVECCQTKRVPKQLPSSCDAGNCLMKPKHIAIQNKRCFVTTLPSSAVMPKLTHTEVRRKLANLKFPIVILGRDQLGASSIEITNSEPPQFNGLDKHIWPFMTDWHIQKYNKLKRMHKSTIRQIHEQNFEQSINTETSKKLNIQKNRLNTKKESQHSKCNVLLSGADEKHKKCNFTSTVYNALTDNLSINPKTEPELKCKGASKLFSRKVPLISLNQKYALNSKHDFKHSAITETKIAHLCKKHDAGTNTCGLKRFTSSKSNPFVKSHTCSRTAVNLQDTSIEDLSVISRCPRTKRDSLPLSIIIDAVLNKIKSGVFYAQEKYSSYTDNSSQTILPERVDTVKKYCIQEEKEIISVKHTIQGTQIAWNNDNTYLPGFDNNLFNLEVKTLTMNELLVKDCTANVGVQFDVIALSDLEKRDTALELMSFKHHVIEENEIKIFKCQTSIFNARLPAEICSLLPNMLKYIKDINRLPNLNLQSISKVSYDDIPDIYASPPIRQLTRNMFSVTLQKLLNGSYLYNVTRDNISIKNTKSRIENVLPFSFNCVCILSLCGKAFDFVLPSLNFLIQKEKVSKISPKINNCTTVAIYKPPQVEHNQNCMPSLPLINGIDKTWNQSLDIVSGKLEAAYNKVTLLIYLKFQNELQQSNISFNAADTKIDAILNPMVKYKSNIDFDTSPKLSIDYNTIVCDRNINKKATRPCKPKTRKGFFKLYKRCKSASCLERASTPLSKITRLEDFFQALGCRKLLTSMFDGHVEKKILSSVSEIRNWITEISQNQAMLILLLANKKDTSNLIRFRPILLQGIAVNRITKVSELDMEIEVIEREHFPKFSRYDGMSYVQDVENQNNLMEEMYWIAKTTASDYQKPFNNSTEKLLRSLLEKRKKLNPSYLRVMARYVGLGLLKPSREN